MQYICIFFQPCYLCTLPGSKSSLAPCQYSLAYKLAHMLISRAIWCRKGEPYSSEAACPGVAVQNVERCRTSKVSGSCQRLAVHGKDERDVTA